MKSDDLDFPEVWLWKKKKALFTRLTSTANTRLTWPQVPFSLVREGSSTQCPRLGLIPDILLSMVVNQLNKNQQSRLRCPSAETHCTIQSARGVCRRTAATTGNHGKLLDVTVFSRGQTNAGEVSLLSVSGQLFCCWEAVRVYLYVCMCVWRSKNGFQKNEFATAVEYGLYFFVKARRINGNISSV